MKKTLLLSLLLAGAFIVFPVSDASAAERSSAAASTEPAVQWQQRRGRGWDNGRHLGRDRVYLQTRTVRRGRYIYRETYRVRVHNGRVTSKLISRTRVYRA